MLDTRIALEGERKQVTVFFPDLKGSMELLADRDPEGARKILDPVLERRTGVLLRYEGTVGDMGRLFSFLLTAIAMLALPLPAAALTVQEAVHRAKPAVVLISVRVEAEVTMNWATAQSSCTQRRSSRPVPAGSLTDAVISSRTPTSSNPPTGCRNGSSSS